jgi:hypothetical protein
MMAPADQARFHVVQRRLAELLPGMAPLSGASPLELSSQFAQEKPRLDPPELLEGTKLSARRVPGDPVARFAAFLDGTQASRVLQYIGGVPLVHGTVAAVVRARDDRRMRTWREPLVSRGLYVPRSLIPSGTQAALADAGIEVFDTAANRDLDSIHPFAIQEAALQSVQRHRSALEKELAEAWIAAGEGELFVDGGISESAAVATSPLAVGVVKSHQQLYVHGDDLPVVLGLRHAERSSVTVVTPRTRTRVASWYLRLRDSGGRDPLWGLVRVEMAVPAGRTADVTRRADEVSRWVLAEALPIALPDGRWDKMVYGIRDCEEFLRAIQ